MAALNLHIDFRSPAPITNQIVEQIHTLVANGDLKPGDQLPTVRELATELRINFNTVARAYRILDEERLISTQRGRGTYIWELPPPEAAGLNRKQLQEAAGHYLDNARRLGFSPQEAVQIIEELLENAGRKSKE